MPELPSVTLTPGFHDIRNKQKLVILIPNLNKSLASGLNVDAAKTIFLNQQDLVLSGFTIEEVTVLLGGHYGFDVTKTGPLTNIRLERDIAGALYLEKFCVDPFAAIQEYKDHDWKKELQPWTTDDSRDTLSFRGFINMCKVAAIYIKVDNYMEKARQEAQRIRSMTSAEWAQDPRSTHRQEIIAQLILDSAGFVINDVREDTRIIDDLTHLIDYRLQYQMLHDFPRALQTTQALDQNAILNIRNLDGFLSGYNVLIKDNILIPAPMNLAEKQK